MNLLYYVDDYLSHANIFEFQLHSQIKIILA